MRLALLIAALFLSAPASAETWLTMSLGSRHFGEDTCNGEVLNEENPGLGAERVLNENWRAVGGAYYNSCWRWSTFVGVLYQPLREGPLRFGITAAVVTGYPGTPLAIMFAPTLSLESHRGIGLNLVGFPRIDGSPGLIALQAKALFF